MIRASTALWAALVILVGYAMFQVKFEVAQQEEQLVRINQKIAENREQVRVLSAEWSFLTQPTRLDQLAHKYLDLVPIGTAQLGAIGTIPLRNPQPTPAPAVAPAASLAALSQRPTP
jgi:hypothetical protein